MAFLVRLTKSTPLVGVRVPLDGQGRKRRDTRERLNDQRCAGSLEGQGPENTRFSKLKAILRRVGARTSEALQDAIIQALPSITPQDSLGLFSHCGYSAPETGGTAQSL